MAKQADTGVYQLRNGNWAFRYTLTENGNKKDVRRSKNENGQKLRSMREAIVARYTKNIHFLSIHFWGWTGLHRRKNCHFYATFTGPDRKKEAPRGCFLCSFSVFPGYSRKRIIPSRMRPCPDRRWGRPNPQGPSPRGFRGRCRSRDRLPRDHRRSRRGKHTYP